MFRDAYAQLAASGVRVVGISPSGEAMHAKFKQKLSIPYSLVSDAKLEISHAYGCRGMFGLPLPFGVRRATFLIGTNRTILDRATGELRLADHDRLLKAAVNRADQPLPTR